MKPTLIRPPEVPGVLSPHTQADFAEMAQLLTAWTHNARLRLVADGRKQSKSSGRWLSPDQVKAHLLALTTWGPMRVAAEVINHRVVANPRNRLYFDGDALLLIKASEGAWEISDHTAAEIGSGAGRRLRQKLAPALLQVADMHQITITATATNSRLIPLYQADLPGLRVVGPGLGGTKLRRDPSSTGLRHEA